MRMIGLHINIDPQRVIMIQCNILINIGPKANHLRRALVCYGQFDRTEGRVCNLDAAHFCGSDQPVITGVVPS